MVFFNNKDLQFLRGALHAAFLVQSEFWVHLQNAS